MTREEELNKASIEYRKSREECGVKDPILLDEVDDAYFLGAIWADKHPIHYDGQAMLHVLHKGVKRGKKEMLDNVCEWLEEHLADFFGESYIYEESDTLDRCLKSMKKAMEDK